MSEPKWVPGRSAIRVKSALGAAIVCTNVSLAFMSKTPSSAPSLSGSISPYRRGFLTVSADAGFECVFSVDYCILIRPV